MRWADQIVCADGIIMDAESARRASESGAKRDRAPRAPEGRSPGEDLGLEPIRSYASLTRRSPKIS
jgi:hypothetical protein